MRVEWSPASGVYPEPAAHLGLIVVIPCFREPEVLPTLNSLLAATPPSCAVEVIWVINAPADAPVAVYQTNAETYHQILSWQAQTTPWFQLIVIRAEDLPPQYAGVGLARRIGMDLAAERFFQRGHQDGVIVCLDADSQVAENYFQALEQHFYREYPKTPACSLAFEHPLEGELPAAIYAGILRYELYLRYYIQGLRYAGLPHAFHTIGSSMAVRAGVYRAQGGMNRRKAGEDFYFLHKLIPLGGFTQLTTTRVFPSPRVSDRVPFGTGRAMGAWLRSLQPDYPVYHPQTFVDLRQLVIGLDGLYPLQRKKTEQWLATLSHPLRAWLEKEGVDTKLQEIQTHSRSENTFRQRFFRWLDGFKTLKLIHWLRDHHYPPQPLWDAACQLAGWRGVGLSGCENLRDLLQIYRVLDLQNYPSIRPSN